MNCLKCAYSPPATPAKNAPTTKASTFIRRVDAHGLGGDFIVSHRQKTAPVGGVNKAQHHVSGQGGEGKGPKKIGMLDHPAETALGTERLGILDNAFDDFIEAEGDDREVVATQAQRGNADGKTDRAPPSALRRPARESRCSWWQRFPIQSYNRRLS